MDLDWPDVSGQQLFEQIHRDHPQVPVIIVTVPNKIQTAVECIKAGAFDYMVKAVEVNRLVSCIRRAIETRQLKRAHSELRSHMLTAELANLSAFSHIVTRNKQMKSIFLYIEAVAKTPHYDKRQALFLSRSSRI